MSETVKYSTLIDLLKTLSAEQPEKLAYTFLVDGKKEGESLTYASLEHRVRAIAALLQKHQVKGERGLLLYPQGLEAIAAFCGCLYSG
ncbi:MAG: fatty acyl-AMP ligase, partial [Okeania sp. SIO2F4]|nr:fatty acyl-AMP ligase [Okeania sp. SIO2F4]